MPLYDLMLLLDPGVPSDRHDAILKEVKTLLDSGGEIVTDQEWGTRRMTFEIDHRPEADYHLLQFETEKGGALLDRVDHSLKIMDGVLRHRIIRLKDGQPVPQPPRPEGRYADAPPVAEGVPAAEGAPAADGAPAPDAAPASDAPPAADTPLAADTAPAADAPAAEAAPAEAAPVETAAPDASSLPPDPAVVADAPAEAPEADEPAPAEAEGDDETPGPAAA